MPEFKNHVVGEFGLLKCDMPAANLTMKGPVPPRPCVCPQEGTCCDLQCTTRNNHGWCGPSCTRPNCMNRRVETPKLHVKETEKCGLGVFAAQDIIKERSYIGEYSGQLLPLSQNDASHYRFHLKGSNGVIDAERCGNVLRYINHTCQYPNVVPMSWRDELGYRRVIFFANCDIVAGEELRFVYGFTASKNEQDESTKFQCHCGAENSVCAGTLSRVVDLEDARVVTFGSEAIDDVAKVFVIKQEFEKATTWSISFIDEKSKMVMLDSTSVKGSYTTTHELSCEGYQNIAELNKSGRCKSIAWDILNYSVLLIPTNLLMVQENGKSKFREIIWCCILCGTVKCLRANRGTAGVREHFKKKHAAICWEKGAKTSISVWENKEFRSKALSLVENLGSETSQKRNKNLAKNKNFFAHRFAEMNRMNGRVLIMDPVLL